ncbi:MAG: dihydroxy-acid dehydratase [Endomicrobium sp.]|nr:dihydroxy-acid dehydratase [Endomicrobium sp.]
MAAINEGHIININITKRTLNVNLSDTEIKERLLKVVKREPKIKTGVGVVASNELL